jgi:heme oxygenase (biliverdin-IX-beta and delta-forming)
MLLLRLREETRPAHHRLEAELDLLSDGLTLERYGAVLTRFHWFLRTWEPVVARLLGDDAFFEPRRKVDLLARDLRALQLRPVGGSCDDLPALGTRAQAMGSLYVVEGSTLGGQLIARHARRSLDLPAGGGTAFFESYGPAVGARWVAFRERLAETSSPLTDGSAVAAARQTFLCLGRVLGGSDIPRREAAVA